jgi:hypothetical protein
MATTACTSPNVVNLVGYLPGTGTTAGTIVTYETPTPDWTDANNQTALQCTAVALGGFNGLNS